MSSPKTTTVKVSLKDIETISYALSILRLSNASLDEEGDDIQRLASRFDRAEERIAKAEDRLL